MAARQRSNLDDCAAPAWSTLLAAVLCLTLISTSAVTAYSCDGTGCCNHVCDPEQLACDTSTSVSIPKWWLDEKNGWESCAAKVSTHYDSATLCSRGIRPDYQCGLKESFACGYGLACVPQTIAYAQCIPICGSRYVFLFSHAHPLQASTCKLQPAPMPVVGAMVAAHNMTLDVPASAPRSALICIYGRVGIPAAAALGLRRRPSPALTPPARQQAACQMVRTAQTIMTLGIGSMWARL